MSIGEWLRRQFGRDRETRETGEADAPGDPGTARTRAAGGVGDSEAANPNSTTGTTPNETFVGRASGDEALDAEKSGGERRAEYERAHRRDGNQNAD